MVAHPAGTPDPRKHLHVRLSDDEASIYDLITEYLQLAGKAPDWYWRTVGRLEGQEDENMEELLSSAFEAGAFLAHDHPESFQFRMVTEKECEAERKAHERPEASADTRQKDRSAMSHYA
jgi:hypothetical protein